MKLKFKREEPRVEPLMVIPVRLKDEAKFKLSDGPGAMEVTLVTVLSGEGVDRLLGAIDEDGYIAVSVMPAGKGGGKSA